MKMLYNLRLLNIPRPAGSAHSNIGRRNSAADHICHFASVSGAREVTMSGWKSRARERASRCAVRHAKRSDG